MSTEKYEEFQETHSPDTAPQVMPAGIVGAEHKPVPPAEKMRCATCRYYWRMVTLGPDLDPDGPRSINHTCTYGPEETDLTDNFVYECNAYKQRAKQL